MIMFDLAITITMIIAGIICGCLFWHFSDKGFKGAILTALGAILGAAAAYWGFLLISLIVWLFITMGCMI